MSDPQQNTHEHIATAIEQQYGVRIVFKRNGWSKNFSCILPGHDDKSPSAALTPAGHYHCQSCGTTEIPALLVMLGLPRADMTDDQRHDHQQTKQERERQAAFDKRERMARNQLGDALRVELSHLSIDDYEAVYDGQLESLLQEWRAGVFELDFDVPVPDVSTLRVADEQLPRDLSHGAFCGLMFALSDKQAALNAYALQWYADGKLTDDVSMPMIAELATGAGLHASERTLKTFMARSIVLDKVKHGVYRMTTRTSLMARLLERVDNATWKRQYDRKPALWMFGDCEAVTEAQYLGMQDYRGNDDAPAERQPFDMDTYIGAIVQLPAVLESITLRAWWWVRNTHERQTISRHDLFLRTGLTTYEQEAARKECRGRKQRNRRIVHADSAADAVYKSGLAKAAAMQIASGVYMVQAANTYGSAGGELAAWQDAQPPRPPKAKGQTFDAIEIQPIGSKDCPLPARPILPTVTKETPYNSVEWLTRALWNELTDNGTVKPADYGGQVVTLDGLLERLRLTIRLDDGTVIPF